MSSNNRKCVAIILMYNDYESTIFLVDTMRKFDSIDLIVVVDNCSTNGSFEKIKPYESSHIHVIKTENNGGVAKGNNFGVRYAESIMTDVAFYLFSNPDVIVNEESIIAMKDFLKESVEYGAVCPMEYTREEDLARDFAWKLPTYWQTVKSIMPIYVHRHQKEKDYLWFYDTELAMMEEVFNAEVIISCFIMVRRSVFLQVGMFCEKTFLYHEEDIFAYKLKQIESKLAVLTQQKVIHLGCTSMNKSMKGWEKKSRIMLDSSIVYLRECLGTTWIGITCYKLVYYCSILERKIFRGIKHLFGHKDE